MSGLTQQFERLSVKRSSSAAPSTGLIPGRSNTAGGSSEPIALKHDKVFELQKGNRWELKNRCDELMILAPANNCDYTHVSAYLEAFWGYLWPAASHNFSPQIGEWSVTRHSGLKEFVDNVITQMGRDQVKPTTECLRGVATYPQGDVRQGRYGMTLTDLMNTRYTSAVTEASSAEFHAHLCSP